MAYIYIMEIIRKTGKLLLWFFVGYIICFLIPFFWNIVIVAILAFGLRKKYRDAFFLIGLVIGAFIRLVIAALVLAILWSHPEYLPLKNRYPVKFLLLLGSELGIYEKIVRHYTKHVSPNIDPFTGKPPKQKNGLLYSVGPDGKDDFLEVIYCPTNGTISPGDILIR